MDPQNQDKEQLIRELLPPTNEIADCWCAVTQLHNINIRGKSMQQINIGWGKLTIYSVR